MVPDWMKIAGWTELHVACAEGDPVAVKHLLSLKPDVNSRGAASGFTPLLVCVSGTDGANRQEIIELLKAAGADLEAKDQEKGLTPLHYTGLRNKPLCARTLLKLGADVNATEVNGATALHGAAFHGNLEVAEVLLEAGADPAARDKHGYTPLFLAEAKGHTALLKALQRHAK